MFTSGLNVVDLSTLPLYPNVALRVSWSIQDISSIKDSLAICQLAPTDQNGEYLYFGSSVIRLEASVLALPDTVYLLSYV